MMINYDPKYLYWPKFETKAKKISKKLPKIIHQMWIGGNPPMNLIETWKNRNPDWTHILWTEENLKQWTFKNQDKIESMSELNGKCDIMRYEILHRMGGFFADADTVCLNSLDDEIFQYDCTSVFECEKHRGGLVACGFMSAQPNCKLLELCINELEKAKSPAWWYVGPAFFTHMIKKHKYPIQIHPSYYFIPRHYTGTFYTGSEKVYCDHLWGVTYKDGYKRFENLDLESPLTRIFYPEPPNRIVKPKTRQHRPKPQLAGMCRRLGILCRIQHSMDHTQDQSQSSSGQLCNQMPISVDREKKSPAS